MNGIIYSIAKSCNENLNLANAKLSNEYYYDSLPFAVIDSIFSIGVRYTTTRKTVMRYCDYYNLNRIRKTSEFSPIEDQHKISNLIQNIDNSPNFAADVLCNKQRTSSKNGMLKADAVYEWAMILRENNIETLQDFNSKCDSKLESDLRNIKGQASGISVSYLKMLCGDDNYCKPDRHIMNFIYKNSGLNCSIYEAQEILSEVCDYLKKDYKNLNLRLLDHTIWRYMSDSTK